MSALIEILEGFAFDERLLTWWQEFQDRTGIEERLVRDADRLELLLQAYVYERLSSCLVC